MSDFPTISERPAVQAAFEEMLRHGVSPRLAEMLALQSPPMSNTDREFWEGRWEQDTPLVRRYRREAERRGVSTNGTLYDPGLAAFPGDPEAFVGGRDDVRRLAEKRGWGVQGAVTVKPAECQPEQIGLDPQIVEDEVEAYVDHHPEPASVDVPALREEITALRTPHWAK